MQARILSLTYILLNIKNILKSISRCICWFWWRRSLFRLQAIGTRRIVGSGAWTWCVWNNHGIWCRCRVHQFHRKFEQKFMKSIHEKIKYKKFRTNWQYHLNSLMVLYSLLHHWAGISNVLIVLPLKSRLMKCQWMHHQELVTSQVLVSSMLRWGRLLKNNDMVNCHFRSNTIKSYWYKVFDNLSSFYSSNFLDTIPNAEHQVGQAINFGITFNKFKPINGLQFAPTSCEVINVNNEDEVYDLWNSNDDTMCNAEDHPVNFQVV